MRCRRRIRSVSPRQRESESPAVRPTYTKILDRAVAVLLEDGLDFLSVQRVLDDASVSRATLSRHFTDVDGLIETALVGAFRAEVDRTLVGVADIVTGSTDRAAFRQAQERNFLRPDFDDRALAVMIQAIAIGRTVGDAAMTHVDSVQ